MTIPEQALADAMAAHAETAPDVFIEAIVTTSTGKVAMIARHTDGRNIAMMCPQKVTTHEAMVAMAIEAFAAQHVGGIPA